MSKLRMFAIGLILLMVIVTYVIPYVLAVLIGIVVIISWIKGRRTSYMSRDEYKAYLRTTKWYSIRQRCFERDHYRCRHCHTAITIETGHCHHKTYRRLGDEQLSDLLTLCKSCHEAHHAKDK